VETKNFGFLETDFFVLIHSAANGSSTVARPDK